jgi:hypothetical protein
LAASARGATRDNAGALLDAVCRIGIPAAADDIVKTLASYVDYDPKGVLRRLTKVLATAEPFGYQSDSLAETSFNGLVAALLSRQRDVIVADAQSRTQLLEALASFVRSRRSTTASKQGSSGPKPTDCDHSVGFRAHDVVRIGSSLVAARETLALDDKRHCEPSD